MGFIESHLGWQSVQSFLLKVRGRQKSNHSVSLMEDGIPIPGAVRGAFRIRHYIAELGL